MGSEDLDDRREPASRMHRSVAPMAATQLVEHPRIESVVAARAGVVSAVLGLDEPDATAVGVDGAVPLPYHCWLCSTWSRMRRGRVVPDPAGRSLAAR